MLLRARRLGATPATAVVAVVEVAAALKILLSLALFGPVLTRSDAFGAGETAVHVLLLAAAGALLQVLGRGDRRALTLGAFFLVWTTAWTDYGLRVGGRALAGSVVAGLAETLVHVQVLAFAPALLWAFARDFPRRQALGRRDPIARACLGACVVMGALLFGASLWVFVAPHGPGAGLAARFDRVRANSLFMRLVMFAMLAALVYAGAQVRAAPADERRRARIMIASIVAGVLPELGVTLVAAFVPAVRARVMYGGSWWKGATLITTPPMLAIPFMTAYAVLVHHALDVRLIIRKALQYALARWTLVGVMAVPFAVLLGLAYAHREQSLASMLSGGSGLALLVLLSTGAGALWLRGRVLTGLDRYFFREQYDARAVLGELVERSRRARDVAELAALVPREIDRALHVQSAGLLVLDPARRALVPTVPGVPPLPVGSGLASRLHTGEMFEADWTRPEPLVAALPPADQQWLADADARLVVPVTDPRGALAGAIALGEKKSELPFSREDRLLLRTIGDAVGLAIEGRRMLAAGAAGECPDCGLVLEAGPATCARCGARLVPAPLPALLAGKYRPLERIGEGGMGVVYLARDETLGREVALKTLPAMEPAEAARLRREARAMAAVSHPNLAAIHAAESWHGAPILVVELLRGGTLQQRLRERPLPAPEALALGIDLAAGLAALHAAGILHRDIKPSNIGFTAEGLPKLLDFGLARRHGLPEEAEPGKQDAPRPHVPELSRLTRSGGLPGTLPYLSPELARGEEPTPAADLWALSLVVYEAIAGRSPFGGDTPELMLLRISRADLPYLGDAAPTAPRTAADFLRECLDHDLRRRPGSAREWSRRAQAALSALADRPAASEPVPAGGSHL